MDEQNINAGVSDISRVPQGNNEIVAEQLPIGLPWRLLIFSAVIFAFSVFIYLGLRIGYRAYIDTQTKDLDTKLDGLAKTITPKDRDAFITFYSQIVNLKTALDKHPFVSNTLTFLEKNTIGTVYFTRALMDTKSNTLELNGIGASFDNVVQQMEIFGQAREVLNAVLQTVSIQSAGVGFAVTLTLRPEVVTTPTNL